MAEGAGNHPVLAQQTEVREIDVSHRRKDLNSSCVLLKSKGREAWYAQRRMKHTKYCL